MQRLFLTFRAVIYGSGFVLFWLWLLPGWLKIRTSLSFLTTAPWRWLGLAPLVAGAGTVIYCVVNFLVAGRGTPAPFDAPRRLVISGPYRFVRNPIYLGSGLFLAGWAILFTEFSLTLLWCAIVIVVAVNLLVLLYEEPTLRRKFDGDYIEYCRNVRRWIPKRT